MARAQPLPDITATGLRALFVGINPSLRSSELRHHYAGHGNRFWRLLFHSGLVPRPLTFEDDRTLLEYGLGSINIVDRATRSSSDLSPEDYALGRRRTKRKIARLRPRVVACVGVVVFRELFETRAPVTCGIQPERIGTSAVFVLPNPSGRNAHYSYARMVELYRSLAEAIRA
jgi:TDG/mug DNA glycosylase family protein